MSFSRAQQSIFRPLANSAWHAYARRHAIDPGDDCAARNWYEDQLEHAAGVRSTKLCTKTRDFERVMARFEAEIGESIEWQIKAETGDDRRVLHEVHKQFPRFDCTSEYLLAIARQALRLDHLPAWPEIPEPDRTIIIRAIVQQARRQDRADLPTDHPRRTKADCPF